MLSRPRRRHEHGAMAVHISACGRPSGSCNRALLLTGVQQQWRHLHLDYNGGDMSCGTKNTNCDTECCFLKLANGSDITNAGECCEMCINHDGCACWSYSPKSRFGLKTCYLKQSTGWNKDKRHSHFAGCISRSSDGDACTCPGYPPPPDKHGASGSMSSGSAALVIAGVAVALYLVIGVLLGRRSGKVHIRRSFAACQLWFIHIFNIHRLFWCSTSLCNVQKTLHITAQPLNATVTAPVYSSVTLPTLIWPAVSKWLGVLCCFLVAAGFYKPVFYFLHFTSAVCMQGIDFSHRETTFGGTIVHRHAVAKQPFALLCWCRRF